MKTLYLAAAAVLAYLLGSISCAIILGRVKYHDDIRRHGSGNAGATNTLRAFGKGAAALVFAGDFFKGWLAVCLGGLIAGTSGRLAAGLFVVLGHIFPVFFSFKGGKGVATAAGVILAVRPPVLGVLLLLFILVTAVSRMVSLGSIFVAAAYPIVTWILSGLAGERSAAEIALSVAMGALVVFMHRANIARLLRGEEHKIGTKKERPAE